MKGWDGAGGKSGGKFGEIRGFEGICPPFSVSNLLISLELARVRVPSAPPVKSLMFLGIVIFGHFLVTILVTSVCVAFGGVSAAGARSFALNDLGHLRYSPADFRISYIRGGRDGTLFAISAAREGALAVQSNLAKAVDAHTGALDPQPRRLYPSTCLEPTST